eukprot:4740090-Pyramimonas_sp.AAC.1
MLGAARFFRNLSSVWEPGGVHSLCGVHRHGARMRQTLRFVRLLWLREHRVVHRRCGAFRSCCVYQGNALVYAFAA